VAWIAFTAFPQYTIPVLAVSAVALFIGGYLAAGVVRPRD
jgi:hypothetical protein